MFMDIEAFTVKFSVTLTHQKMAWVPYVIHLFVLLSISLSLLSSVPSSPV